MAEFAALLTELKERTDRSYGSLARRLGMNTSTLHRYCAGEAVPQDFAPLERLAEFCGASPEERLELHRRWLHAVAARQRPRAAGAPESPQTPETAPQPSQAQATQESPDEKTDARAPHENQAPPRPWYRRRRSTVLIAVACALLATLGTLSALPGGTRSPAADTDRSSATGHPSGTTVSTTPLSSSTPTAGVTASPTPGTASPAPRSGGTSPSPDAAPAGGAASAPASGVPLVWTADSQVWALNCSHDYVIDKPPAQVPPPPAEQDAGPWASAQGAVHGRETNVEISVQGRSSTAVVLTALRVRVVGRTTPAPGTVYAMDQGCGGALGKRYFAVDLDKDRPVAHSIAGNDSGTPIPAVSMPYRVSSTDPEVLLVTARTDACDCDWYLELDWSSQGRTGTVRVDDHGRPFRTSAIKGLPRYWYGSDNGERKWVPATD
ncbi:helix-turn-helix domain-containing protein [Streptomyces sp. NBC_01275]|uniref:helix-turn-helix domain-containing protein n=1 Tax=Streptomyces sp. NBC_01275 TaxID=2903807 RepID=UPI00224D713D|nr:helix-turn-helix domain-containing protein [Streptomyces sp. NBC_01275]MCX4765799.1 helix-turn-helix domain-containing protein [Streptomyces sp. NBC_01275]